MQRVKWAGLETSLAERAGFPFWTVADGEQSRTEGMDKPGLTGDPSVWPRVEEGVGSGELQETECLKGRRGQIVLLLNVP